MQVAQALRDKCQRYLAGQLPNNQADVAQAAGIVPASNEPTVSPTNNMQVDDDSQVAGMLLPQMTKCLYALLSCHASHEMAF